MITKKYLVLLGICGLVISSYAIAQTDRPARDGSAKEELLNLMTDEAMITSIKDDLLVDERLAYMVSHELMVQKLMQEKEFMTKIEDGLALDKNPKQRKMLMEKISTTLMKMMVDKEAKQRVIKDIMVRQIAANQRELMGEGGAKK